MTCTGTNTYLVGRGTVAVIDPGPDDDRHLAAILAALAEGERVSHVLVTHAHRDHTALARRLADAVGAPVCGFGPAGSGRSATMERLAAGGLAGGGEGMDAEYAPDLRLAEGDAVEGPDWRLAVLHVPGHTADHVAFAAGPVVFTGDTVMGWASSIVSPPDGDLTAFMVSVARLAALGAAAFHPGHGEAVADPRARAEWLIAHRRAREAQILAALAAGETSVPGIAGRAYADTPAALRPAAERNVLAHLIDLWTRDLVRADPDLTPAARYTLR
jgi:glyoxylase-like metal-dependent hydrolase (beta-lactamase superfamily II)